MTTVSAYVDCRQIPTQSNSVISGYMDGCHGYDWGGSRYTTPALNPDQLIIGLQLSYNSYGLCTLTGIICCSVLKLDDPDRVISLVPTTDGFGNLITVGNSPNGLPNTGDTFILPLGYALTGMRQLSCNKIRQLWLVGTNFAGNQHTIGPIAPALSTGNVNGNASPTINIVGGGAFSCITRITWNYRGDPENGSNGLTGITDIYWKDFTPYTSENFRKTTIDRENVLSMTKANNALPKYTLDYFGTDALKDNFADQYCPTADLTLPGNKWCACYLSRTAVLSNPELLKKYPFAKYTTQPQCWNDLCLTDGYKNAGLRSSTSCPSIKICTQDLASVSGANNLLNNVLLTQDCSDSSTKAPPPNPPSTSNPSGTPNPSDIPNTTLSGLFSGNNTLYIFIFLIVVVLIIFQSRKSNNDYMRPLPYNNMY